MVFGLGRAVVRDGRRLMADEAVVECHRVATMIQILKASLAALVVLVISQSPSLAQERATRPPNIVVVLFDDVGFMDVGAYGGDARTPSIDALARRGIMLSRYYTSPFCGPSRAMLMTGMDNHQVGMGTLVETATDEMRAFPGYSMVWENEQATIASLLSGAGYQTYVTGKWGIGEIGANLPNRFGFDRSYVMDATGGGNYDAMPYLPGSHSVEWFEDGRPVTLPEDWYSSTSLVDKMIEYIGEGDQDRPFFAFLSLQALHMPIQVSAEYTNRYEGVFDAGWDVMRQQRLERAIALGLVPPTTRLAPAPASHRRWDELTPRQQAVSAREMQVNAGMMEAADFEIGRLIEYLESTGQLDNTIVVIASDNGSESGMTTINGPANLVLDAVKWLEGFDTSYENLGLRRSLTAIGPEWALVSSAPFDLYKFYGSEGGLRVPLVIAGPGIASSGIEHAPMHVADLVPTLLDAAGVPFEASQFYGRSALPMLSGASEITYADDESFAIEVSGNAALYRGSWKITRNTLPMGDGQWRLYDLSVDPGETTDLSAENPELFESMLAEYQTYAEQVGVIELAPDDNAISVLTRNLTNKVIQKYWPHMLGFVLALLAVGYFMAKFGWALLRRRPA
jgi:arylsulfatase A-like enzyme